MHRIVASLALALAVLPSPATAQTLPTSHELTRKHLAVVAAERRDRFQRAFEAADLAGRARARDVLLPKSGPLFQWPEATAIERARLAADSEREPTTLEWLTACLDMQVVTDAFDPSRPEHAAISCRARVWPLQSAEAPPEVEVSIVLTRPTDERQVLRSETAEAAAFAAPGFDLFFEVPMEALPGSRLRLELEANGERVAGDSIALSACDASNPEPGMLDPRAYGVRSIQAADDRSQSDPDSQTARLIVTQRSGEAPRSVLHGLLGERWRAVAAEHGLQLVVLEREEGLIPTRPDDVVVVRADAALALGPALLASPARIVATQLGPRTPTYLKRGLLLLKPDANLPKATDAIQIAHTDASPFLADLALPEVVGTWLESRAASDSVGR